ncbi:MAG TPA: hypothetical protein VES02_00400 [Dermatophilaceae bacterium]|nr:hypothetical protein [Dermatophilaceae bacterium]
MTMPGGYRFGDYWKFGLPLMGWCAVISIPVVFAGEQDRDVRQGECGDQCSDDHLAAERRGHDQRGGDVALCGAQREDNPICHRSVQPDEVARGQGGHDEDDRANEDQGPDRGHDVAPGDQDRGTDADGCGGGVVHRQHAGREHGDSWDHDIVCDEHAEHHALVAQGSHDGDVTDQTGQFFYEGPRLAPDQSERVVSTFLEGASHNKFNTVLPPRHGGAVVDMEPGIGRVVVPR